MNRKDFENKLESFIDFLDEALPNTDIDHRDEVLDIAELLRQRACQFVSNYGLN